MKTNPYPHLVFVYGTLMSPHGNNPVMTGPKGRDALLVGKATTIGKFYMAGGGFPRVGRTVEGNFPVSEKAGRCHGQIRGELWELNEVALKACDRLESHPRFYRREEVPVTVDGKRTRRNAWIYLIVTPFAAYSALPKATDGTLSWGTKETLKW